MRIEKSLYPLKIWIVYIVIIFLYATCLALFYINIGQFKNGIFSICLLAFLTVLLLWPIIQIIKYKPFSAKIIMDDEGIRYKSKAAGYFMPWNKLKKVMKIAPGEIQHLYLLDDSVKTMYTPLTIRKISNNRMWVFFYPEMLDFIERHWNGRIDNIEYIKKQEAKKQARKQRRLEKKRSK